MGFSKYHLVKKALDTCGFELQKYNGCYKYYRYRKAYEYNIIEKQTKKTVVHQATIQQIYDFLIKKGVIEFTEE